MGSDAKPATTPAGERFDAGTGELLSEGPRPLPARVEVGTRGLLAGRDLQVALQEWERDRDYVRQFLREYLREAEYNDRGYPINGRMHDYYRLPGAEPSWKPTEVGAEKVALFFGLFKAQPEVTVTTESKDYVSVRARVVLVDGQGNVRGAGEKVVSSLEKTFKDQIEKAGGDHRAILNVIASRAAKRAYVEAVTITCALGELFNEIARERASNNNGGKQSQATDPKRADPKPDAHGRPTVMTVGAHAGVPLRNLSGEYLAQARAGLEGRARHAKLIEAIDEELERRRLDPLEPRKAI